MPKLPVLTLAASLASTLTPVAFAWDDTRRISALPPKCLAGVTCSVSVTPGFMAGQVTLDFRARAPTRAATRTDVRVYDRSGAVITATTAGFLASGDISVLLANGQSLAPGNYRYVIDGVAQGTFEVLTGAARTRPAANPGAPSTSAALAGTWYGIAGTPGSIELRSDGSYKFNGKSGGRYRRIADEVLFDGALASWNEGRARLKDGVLEFKWKNAQGFENWFVFQKT